MGIAARLNGKQFNGHRLRRIPHPLDDVRDHLYPCAAVDHSAALLGTSFAALVNSVAAELPPAALAKLRAFDGREGRDRSLQAFELRTDGDGDDFRYR